MSVASDTRASLNRCSIICLFSSDTPDDARRVFRFVDFRTQHLADKPQGLVPVIIGDDPAQPYQRVLIEREHYVFHPAPPLTRSCKRTVVFLAVQGFITILSAFLSPDRTSSASA